MKSFEWTVVVISHFFKLMPAHLSNLKSSKDKYLLMNGWFIRLKEKTKTPESTSAAPVAYIFEWSDIADVQLLSAFLQKGLKPRVSGKAFTLEGRDYKPGTLVLPRTGHERMGAEFDTQVKALAKEHNRSYQAVSSAYTSKGSSFGAESVSLIKPLRVGLLSGQGTAVNNVGEIWHFFDETINYPLEIILWISQNSD